ncbi:amidohydrolase [Olleya namhaensis]|uniref:amidohydrolase n=1 Tax=Olleya namhaensis TaxID=1144750 RepID=UPI002490D694|nr:amidohydrolase family protein [Olleya namhaensis]
MKNLILCLILLITFVSCQKENQSADLVITNAVIWTGNSNMPKAEAIAIKADTIFAVGLIKDIQKLIGPNTKQIDAKQRFITPGFIDSHVHLLMGGNSLLNVELRDAKTPEEFSERIKTFVKTVDKETWIVEGNWDHTLWGGELPKKEWIDDFTKDNPVAVYRLDGHMILANSAALKIAGIDKNTPEVENGVIVRHPDGTPTGILKSEAMYLVLNKIPELTTTQKEAAIHVAQEYLLSQGITTVHDVDSLGGFAIAKKMKANNTLKIRIYSADPLYKWNKVKRHDVTDKWLKNGLLKGFVDGSLGSHTAAFTEPYSDKPEDSGLFINTMDDLYSWTKQGDSLGFQVTIHAIGDKSNHELLNVYEKIKDESEAKDRRFRIEHAQHLLSEDINRFAKLNVIASVQPYHAIDDGRWAEELIGAERIKTTYAFNDLMSAGATVVFGSDWPVAPASPLYGIYAAVTRQTLDNKNPNGWVGKQKITVEQALLAYTKNGAYGSFDENLKGTLEVGKLADFVILDSDITIANPEAIKDIKVLATYIAGKKVYDSSL